MASLGRGARGVQQSAVCGSTSVPWPLRERLRATHSFTHRGAPLPPPRADRSHVLYLLRSTFRVDSNPALDVALIMSRHLSLPLICVAEFPDTFPRSMDDGMEPPRRPTNRETAFRLEALQELVKPLQARGCTLFVNVHRDGCRYQAELSMAAKAALVVCDEHFGIEPFVTATDRVARTGAPVWLCDTSCTVPSCILDKAALRGGNKMFLSATAALRKARLAPGWFPRPSAAASAAATAVDAAAASPPRPAWAVDLSTNTNAIATLLAAPSRRDVTVTRVRHTRGGPRAALKRWQRYLARGGLKTYARHRNDPLREDGRGGSRMSAYINTGMISPIMMARDATKRKSGKFLEELVGFRESACLWCLRHPRGYMNAIVAVPRWAQQQLAAPRGGGYSPDTNYGSTTTTPELALLERGESGAARWDDCQRSLILAGELHNNVRMAWGKAIPAWHTAALRNSSSSSRAPTPSERLQAALFLLIRLNDKVQDSTYLLGTLYTCIHTYILIYLLTYLLTPYLRVHVQCTYLLYCVQCA